MLASDLCPLLSEEGYEVVALSRTQLDITDASMVRDVVERVQPWCVVNCAAYTRVDDAEDEKDLAFSVNAAGAGNLAMTAGRVGARLVHVSTDFVFDGEKNVPYKEDDAPNPLNTYGMSKLQGERLVRDGTDDYIIIRSSWLYGPGGENFVRRIISKAGESEELSVVYDQVGSPTYTADLAAAVLHLMEEAPAGVYNFSNEGVASWYDLAYMAVEAARAKGVSLKLRRLKPILTEEYPTPAKRPRYSVLDKERYRDTTGTAIAHWVDALSRYVDSMWQGRRTGGGG